MKKLIILMSLFASLSIYGDSASIVDLIDALVIVESNGKSNAIGDNGKAFGVLQMHEIMVKEANRIGKTNFVHSDAFDANKSKVMAAIVLSHYKKYIENKKGNCTLKDLARCWNGGLNAYKFEYAAKERNLEIYWNKVLKELKKFA